MGKERKTDRRYAITNIPGDPGLSDAQIAAMRVFAKVKNNSPLVCNSIRRLDAEFFLRRVSELEDAALDDVDFEELMPPSWNL